MVLDYKSKRKQVSDLCDALEFPVFFSEDLEIHDDRIILKRSDGYVMVYLVEVRPTVINKNAQIELDVKLTGTGYNTSLNMPNF